MRAAGLCTERVAELRAAGGGRRVMVRQVGLAGLQRRRVASPWALPVPQRAGVASQ
jgi:hypothetical protein